MGRMETHLVGMRAGVVELVVVTEKLCGGICGHSGEHVLSPERFRGGATEL